LQVLAVQPDEYSKKILTESADGSEWEWKTVLRPTGWSSGNLLITFADELRRLLSAEFEVIEDMDTDSLIVRRTFQEEKPRFVNVSLGKSAQKPRTRKPGASQGELF
jgi:hypothetical protein